MFRRAREHRRIQCCSVWVQLGGTQRWNRCGDAARTSRCSAGVDDGGSESGPQAPGELVRGNLRAISRAVLVCWLEDARQLLLLLL